METNSQQQAEPFALQREVTPSSVIPTLSDDSLYRKGVKLLYGIGVEREPQRAVQYFREGYETGDLNAGYMLAICLTGGDGTARDFDEAFQIASDLANKNFYPAYYLMADAYKSGKGVAMDPDKGESCNDTVIKHCSDPLPGVDESLRFEALLASMMSKKEVDLYAVGKVAQRNREISDRPQRHGLLALFLLRMAEESTLAKLESHEVIEAGCAEGDILSFYAKAIVQTSQEHYKEAQETLKRGLKIAPGCSFLCDLMWMITALLHEDIDKARQVFWEACALGVSAMRRGNDLGVKIEIAAPPFAGGWVVYRWEVAEEKLKNGESICFGEPVIIVKNTSDEKLEGATIRLCSADAKLDKTFNLDPIPPQGEISLEAADLDNIRYGENLYVRVSKGNRYSEMDLDTVQGLNIFRPPLMPLMMTWKRGVFGGNILQLRCLEGTLSNIVITKGSGATARIPQLGEYQGPVSVGWMEFSDWTSLVPFEYFVVECDGYAPVMGVIKFL